MEKEQSTSLNIKVAIKDERTGETKKSTHGPYQRDDMPVQLKGTNVYKYLLYVLLDKGFNQLSGEVVSAIGGSITKLTELLPQHAEQHRTCCQAALEGHICTELRIVSCEGKEGIPDLQLRKVEGQAIRLLRKRATSKHLRAGQLGKGAPGTVSIHAFDPRNRKFITQSYGHRQITLVYQVKDEHCFSIINHELKATATKVNAAGCTDLMKHIIDIKWTMRHDNVRLLDSFDELAALDVGDHILILPEDMPMKEAINRYCIFLSTGYYAEYLHCRNSRSVLDGMVDHKGNMILLNERYTDPLNDYITQTL